MSSQNRVIEAPQDDCRRRHEGRALMNTLDRKYVQTFFRTISEAFPTDSGLGSIVVTHLLPDRPFFLEGVSALTNIVSVIPKPKSIYPEVRHWLKHRYQFDALSRDQLANPAAALQLVESRGKKQPLVILDLGGYFARAINYLAANYSGSILGVIEDTENGFRRYRSVKDLACPVISVARSPLKEPEDYLVGQSIVYSVEALLREQGDILHGRTACVIGYGKLGESIASLLHARRVNTVVFDLDPIKSLRAMAHGFSVPASLRAALRTAGFVFCATGNISLTNEAFAYLNDGAYVATVTSSDDELQTDGLEETYHIRHISDYVTRYSSPNHHFFLLNRGQAVNFIHGAVVGPFIYLIQAEIAASISRLQRGGLSGGIHENDDSLRRAVAERWYSVFGKPPTAAPMIVTESGT